VTPDIDIVRLRHGISHAALAHNAQINKLQAELHEAYKHEIEAASAVAEKKRFSEELHSARTELEMYRKKLAETERKLAALSKSRLGALQLQYWRWRRGRGNG
jgi:nucleoid-associated protein YejK